MKQAISNNVLELLDLTIDDYLSWCTYHEYVPTNRKNKTEFFKMINDRTLIKKHGRLYENGVELTCENN